MYLSFYSAVVCDFASKTVRSCTSLMLAQVGRTESIAHQCNPVFSRPVIVTYKGAEEAQV